jgi:hypothetical protein
MKTNESNFASTCFHLLAFICGEFARWLHPSRPRGWFVLWPKGVVRVRPACRVANSPPEPTLLTSGGRTRRSLASWAADEPAPNSKALSPRWREAPAGAAA